MKSVPVSTGRKLTRPSVAQEQESQYTNEELEFIHAIDRYKKINKRPFPTWSEVLEIARVMGYRKIMPPKQPKSYQPK